MHVYVIAEIGINHNGSMEICKDLIDIATESGCDAVKFQKRDIDQVYTQEFLIHQEKAHGDQLNASKKWD